MATFVGGNFDGTLEQTTIEWEAGFRPTQWQIQVSQFDDFSDIAFQTTVPGNVSAFLFAPDPLYAPFARVRPIWGTTVGSWATGDVTHIDS